jgi:hypothetical protein
VRSLHCVVGYKPDTNWLTLSEHPVAKTGLTSRLCYFGVDETSIRTKRLRNRTTDKYCLRKTVIYMAQDDISTGRKERRGPNLRADVNVPLGKIPRKDAY